MLKKLDKNFVSEIDLFLQEVRKDIPQTEAQILERKKYNEINYLRDHEVALEDKPELWDDF